MTTTASKIPAAIAQFETEIRAERQMDGIQDAKARGVRFGSKKSSLSSNVLNCVRNEHKECASKR